MSDDHYHQDSHPGRAESPRVENALQDAVVRALKELLQNKGMYQNLRIDDASFKSALPPALTDEFRTRPYMPHSRGGMTPVGGTGIGTPTEQMPIGFYLPAVTLPCPTCAHSSSYLSNPYSKQKHFDDPYPLLGADTEQVWSLYYSCSVCRKHHIVFQVVRKGFRLQLTGRSTPFRPAIAKEWPKEIKEIIEDAYLAVSEGDVPAGYYHLRTAVEFYLKTCLSVPVEMKVDGTELCEKYNMQADERLKLGFPTFGPMYSELSLGLHSRAVSVEGFTKISSNFLGHLKAKAMFAEYAPQ